MKWFEKINTNLLFKFLFGQNKPERELPVANWRLNKIKRLAGFGFHFRNILPKKSSSSASFQCFPLTQDLFFFIFLNIKEV